MRKTAYIPAAIQPPTYDEAVSLAAGAMDAEYVAAGMPYTATQERSLPWVIARVMGLLFGIVYRYATFGVESILALTARHLETLKSIGSEVGVYWTSGTFANGRALAIARNAYVGGTVPAGKLITDKLTGRRYVTTASVVVPTGGSADVPIQASAVGSEYLCSAHPGLMASPPSGISADMLITADTGGIDNEDPDELRTRILERKRNPPEGGAFSDYREWARTISTIAVDGVWVYEPETPCPTSADPSGYVPDNRPAVAFTLSADGIAAIPDAGDVSDMADHLTDYVERPVSDKPIAFAPAPFVVALDINARHAAGYESRHAEVEAYLDAALQDKVRDLSQVAETPGVTIPNSELHAAIQSIAGLSYYGITGIGSGGGDADVVPTYSWSYIVFNVTVTWL